MPCKKARSGFWPASKPLKYPGKPKVRVLDYSLRSSQQLHSPDGAVSALRELPHSTLRVTNPTIRPRRGLIRQAF